MCKGISGEAVARVLERMYGDYSVPEPPSGDAAHKFKCSTYQGPYIISAVCGHECVEDGVV